MAKILFSLLVVAALAVIVCQAEPAQRRQQVRARPVRYTRPRTRVLARQEEAPVEEEAVTPYPSADELKPEVPFVEEAESPATVAEPIPDEVYGPPEADQGYAMPDEVYGPPEVNENDLPAADEIAAAETFPAPLDEEQPAAAARYVAARRGQLRRKAAYRQAAYRKVSRAAAAKSGKLRSAAPVRRSA